MDKIKYKHIYHRTIKHKHGNYEYYIVQVRNKGNKLGYVGCSRRYDVAEGMLLNYAEIHEMNIFDLLK
jgi:hypothetical protein